MVAENLSDVFSKLWLGASATIVHDSRILERPGKQEEVATLNGGTSDVLGKDRAKVPDDAVEATAVDQAEGRFQSQIQPCSRLANFRLFSMATSLQPSVRESSDFN